MLIFNRRMKTLEPEEYDYKLQNPSEPNLYRETFSYGEIPKIPFNHRKCPMFPPDDIWITDTTFRDGQQARPPYTVEQIVDLFKFLHRLGGPNGVIRQSEFFLYSKKDQQAVTKCLELGHRYPEITGWIRARKKDFKLVKEMGLRETGILTSASDYHIYLKLRMDRKKATESYLDIVKAALEEGIVPRCHLEDATRADFYGFIVPFAHALNRLSEESGIPIKLRVCDTLGYGIPYPGASMPRSVPGLIYGLVHYGGFASERLEWHGHNDFYKVLVNAATAWLYGCSAVNCALLGLGERTGNTPTEAAVIEYIMLRGSDNGTDTTVINEIAEYFENVIGYRIPPNQPLVGRDFNVTRAGIHADGLMKNEEIYNMFDTAKILNRPPGIAITDKSGAAGIAAWINTYCKLDKDKRIDKSQPAIEKMKAWVDGEFNNGRITSVSDKEMIDLVKEHLPELIEKIPQAKITG